MWQPEEGSLISDYLQDSAEELMEEVVIAGGFLIIY